MQHSYTQYILIFLCISIIIDNTETLRLRLPSLRISSTFSKAADCIKKKARMIGLPIGTGDLKGDRPVEPNGDL